MDHESMIRRPLQSLVSLVLVLSHGSLFPIQRLTSSETNATQRSRSQHRPPHNENTNATSTWCKGENRRNRTRKRVTRERREKERRGRREHGGLIGDGCRSKGAEEGRGGPSRRRRPQEEAGLSLREGRPPVPRRPYRPLPQAGSLLPAYRHRRPRLPRRRPRVPRRRGPRVGGERSAGQQEEPDHPAARSAGDPQRRGAREAAGRRHHRARRGSAQHQPCAAPQEDSCCCRQGGQREEVTQEGRRQVAQEGGRRIGPRQCQCPVSRSLSLSALN